MDQKYTQPDTKNRICCQKCFSLLRSLVFVVKDTFIEGLRMRHCVDFVAYSYPACELKYTDPIFMRLTRILTVMTVIIYIKDNVLSCALSRSFGD